MFLGLRGQLLDVDPAELRLSPSERLPRVWAVLQGVLARDLVR
jgi:hypothetical protein